MFFFLKGKKNYLVGIIKLAATCYIYFNLVIILYIKYHESQPLG